MSKKPTDQWTLEEIVRLANDAGLAYVAAKKQAERLELLKPTRKAEAMERYDDGKQTETKIRRMGEMDRTYVEFLEQLSEARGESERLRIRYESYKNLFEARRSSLSFQKAEMKLL